MLLLLLDNLDEEWCAMLVNMIDIGPVLVHEPLGQLAIEWIRLEHVHQDCLRVVVLLIDARRVQLNK